MSASHLVARWHPPLARRVRACSSSPCPLYASEPVTLFLTLIPKLVIGFVMWQLLKVEQERTWRVVSMIWAVRSLRPVYLGLSFGLSSPGDLKDFPTYHSEADHHTHYGESSNYVVSLWNCSSSGVHVLHHIEPQELRYHQLPSPFCAQPQCRQSTWCMFLFSVMPHINLILLNSCCAFHWLCAEPYVALS